MEGTNLERNWEYLEGTSCVNIKFSLKNHLSFWENNLQPSSFVYNVLQHGYILPFNSIPPPIEVKNNKSSLRHKDFVGEALEELENQGLIKRVHEKPHCVNPLTVSDKGKLRLVLDLRHMNNYITPKKFRYEDLKMLAEIIEKGDFFVNFDLKSGYHHIDIHPDHQTYLGFSWQGQYFVFTVLPFGLNSASYVFTKMLRPFIKIWRSAGIKSVVYLDDGIAAQKTRELAEAAGQTIIQHLTKAGWYINWEKSNFKPKQEGTWLGTKIDTRSLCFYVPCEKLESLKGEIMGVLKRKKCTARELSQIAGRLSSMYLSLGKIVRLFTRKIYRQIEARHAWSVPLTMDEGTTEELRFWVENVEKINGCSFKAYNTTTKMVFTDASSSGYGGYMVTKLGQHICVGKFNEDDEKMSSTFRELLAVKLVLHSYGKLLEGQAIQINSDNQAATTIIEIGSTKYHLQQLALEIFDFCLKHDIKLVTRWIPRNLNRAADYYSKIKDTDSWGVDEESFEYIQSKFGPFQIDRFADEKNKKVSTFNSKYYCPGTAHINAFTDDWSGINNWICPPVKDIPKVIRHMKLCKACGTLLIPHWPSAFWWPLIYPDGKRPSYFVRDVLLLDPYYTAYSKDSVFNGFQTFKTLALKVDFTEK